jgi:hypothetical protein
VQETVQVTPLPEESFSSVAVKESLPPACTELELAETETMIGEDALTDELPPPPQAVIVISEASARIARTNHAAVFILTSQAQSSLAK